MNEKNPVIEALTRDIREKAGKVTISPDGERVSLEIGPHVLIHWLLNGIRDPGEDVLTIGARYSLVGTFEDQDRDDAKAVWRGMVDALIAALPVDIPEPPLTIFTDFMELDHCINHDGSCDISASWEFDGDPASVISWRAELWGAATIDGEMELKQTLADINPAVRAVVFAGHPRDWHWKVIILCERRHDLGNIRESVEHPGDGTRYYPQDEETDPFTFTISNFGFVENEGKARARAKRDLRFGEPVKADDFTWSGIVSGMDQIESFEVFTKLETGGGGGTYMQPVKPGTIGDDGLIAGAATETSQTFHTAGIVMIKAKHLAKAMRHGWEVVPGERATVESAKTLIKVQRANW